MAMDQDGDGHSSRESSEDLGAEAMSKPDGAACEIRRAQAEVDAEGEVGVLDAMSDEAQEWSAGDVDAARPGRC